MLFSHLLPMEGNKKTSISKHLFKQSFGSLLFSLGKSLDDSGRYSAFFIKCLSLISRKKMLHHMGTKRLPCEVLPLIVFVFGLLKSKAKNCLSDYPAK